MSINTIAATKSLFGSIASLTAKVQTLPQKIVSGAAAASEGLKKLEQRQTQNSGEFLECLDPELAKIFGEQSVDPGVCEGTPANTQPKPKLVAQESDVTAGELKVNDAYDLSLYQLPGGDYRLDMSMKLQFFFEKGSGGSWTDAEKKQYLQDWQSSVKSAWDGKTIALDNGKKATLNLKFDVQEGGWMADHWELSVSKIKSGGFEVSSVNTGTGNVNLDSEDLKAVTKNGGQVQRGNVHEFGHMMGLDDEYPASSTHHNDRPSIMNSGEQVKPRHLEFLKSWITEKLAHP